MKYAMILPDGAADEPIESLDGRTPLEAAHTPNMDWISTNGRQGRVVTVPEGFLPGSDVATMTLFGYDPHEDYTGRAPLEAAAQGLHVGPNQTVFRCNFITVTEGLMADFTAGHISSDEASKLIDYLNEHLADLGCQFHAGVSYRNLMLTTLDPKANLSCTPPHDFPDQPVSTHQPRGKGGDWVRSVMDRAREKLATHDINLVRADLGENPATDIWLWGQGHPKPLQPFSKRFGMSTAVIAAVDLIRGLARSLRMKLIDVPGATGYLDTDYEGKGQAALAALEKYDMVVVHVEAPDEAGHLGDLKAKIEAIERVDEWVVGPLLEKLRSEKEWRILIAPDHPTPVGTRVHSSTPPPFCLAGTRIQSVKRQPFSEKNSLESDLLINPGHELMEYFLKV